MDRNRRGAHTHRRLQAAHLLLVTIVACAIAGPETTAAFQLWPNRLTRALGHTRQDSTAIHRNNHRPTTSTTSTTTTTTTTTPLPPIELHFEINPEILEQQQQQQQESNELGEQVSQTGVNGTLIFEDLVNQFERNFNLKRALHKTPNGEGQHGDDGAPPHLSAIDHDEPQLADGSQNLSGPREQRQQQQHTIVISTLDDSQQVNKSAQYKMSEPDEPTQTPSGGAVGEPTTTNDSLVDTPDPDPDRYIQYDTVVGAPTGPLIEQVGQRADWPNGTALPASTVADPGSPNETTTTIKPPAAKLELAPVQNSSLASAPAPTDNNNRHQVSPSSKTEVAASVPTTTSSQPASSSQYNSSQAAQGDEQPVPPPSQVVVRSSGPSQAQPRSMSGVSSRLPQHSKAPYASYNLFSQRSDASGRPSSSAVTTTTPIPNGANSDGQPAKSWQHKVNRPADDNGAVSSQNAPQQDQQRQATTNNKLATEAEQANRAELANSINRISSNLAAGDEPAPAGPAASPSTSSTSKPGSSATPTSTTTTAATTTANIATTPTTSPRPITLVDQLQAYLNGANNNRQEQRDELERVASKLTPINELIELEPLPADGGQPPPTITERHYSGQHGLVSRNDRYSPTQMVAGSNDATDQLNSIGGYGGLPMMDAQHQHHRQPLAAADDSNDQIMRIGLSQARPHSHQNHNHHHHHQQPQQQQQGDGSGSVRASDLKNVVSSLTGRPSSHESPPDDNGQDEDLAPAVLHRKTLETLSNQIKHSDSSLLAQASSQNTMVVHQHKERSPPQQQPTPILMGPLNRGMSGGGGGATYAASLINVTAPMVLPLSASEAMEASIASLNKQQQESSHRRPAEGGGGNSQSQQSQLAAPHRSGYYVIPAAPPAHESIYSRPANQFRPAPAVPTASTQYTEQHASRNSATPTPPSADKLRTGDGHYGPLSGSPALSASGFRSPLSQYPAMAHTSMLAANGWPFNQHTTGLPTPASYLNGLEASTAEAAAAASSFTPTTSSAAGPQLNKLASSTPTTPTGGGSSNRDSSSSSSSNSGGSSGNNKNNNSARPQQTGAGKQQPNATITTTPTTTNGFITGSVVNTTLQPSQIDLIGAMTAGNDAGQSVSSQPGSVLSQAVVAGGQQQQQPGKEVSKRVFNLTRVEHISAECSNDLIRTVIIFNGTFKGIIYSSGYVRDPNCLYVNGTGKTRYDFSIRLNQCGTLGRQELHSPVGPDEVRRRDQVMWNSLSIQYNPIIEQEWDEHFRVSCEYGSDFWKTISFNPFNVETNTGSPVVFTVDPPQCQMEILKGHGMVGPRQEAISGPVTVGDPLTLLIHMKSEKGEAG
jgi:hypothetical protein